MKFILLDIKDIKKDQSKRIYLNDKKDKYINELCLSYELLHKRMESQSNIFYRLKSILYDKKFNKTVVSLLEDSTSKWYYILSKNFNEEEAKFITNMCEYILGYKYNVVSELNTNIFKYVQDHVANGNIKKHELKALLIYENMKNINFALVKSLINEYKKVDIFLKEKPTEYALKQVKLINKTIGSTIEFIKPDKKALKEYDVVYFVDTYKENFPRLRLRKEALIIDKSYEADDKYNSNILYVNRLIENNELNKENIQTICDSYGKLKASAVICKLLS